MSQRQSDSSVEVDVAIIGAGIAGLKAAQTLIDGRGSVQVDDFLVLEAQDRIGGRIYTDSVRSRVGHRYDLGASWFHDSLSNSTLQDLLGAKYGAGFDLHRDGYFDDMEPLVFHDGAEGPLDLNALKMHSVMEELEKFIELYFFEDLEKPDVSMREIVDRYIETRSRFLTPEQTEFLGSFMRYLELWHGISWDVLSAKYSVMDHQGRNLFNKQGYSALVEAVSKKIPKDRLRLNCPVTAIDRSVRNERTVLKCENGDEVRAKYVIVTVPLSILGLEPSDSQAITWNPPLPESIQASFKSIHFGALGKVVFEFDSVWWDKTQDRFEILGSTSAKDTQRPLTQPPDPFTYSALVVNYSKIVKSDKGSLVILTQSPLTEYLEKHPQKAWDYFKPMLGKLVIDGKSLQDPINVITTDWTTNKYIRGSYTALHVNDNPSDLIIQLSGQDPHIGLGATNIRFAGEHTIMDGAGCVHGAYNSGTREATWVLDKVANKS